MLGAMTLARARFRARSVVLLLGAAAFGCFNPSDSDSDGGTGTEGSESSSVTNPSSATMTGSDTETATMTASMTASDTVDDSGSTSAPDTTDDATVTGPDDDGSSTGEPSNCPGGDPTPGEAPYVSMSVDAIQDTDDTDLGDIDGDGHLDLINLSRVDTSVETLWGDGMGGFTSDGVEVLGKNGFPDMVRVGAIADDTLDIFVHMEGPVQLVVARGDGTGNWPNPQVYTSTYVRAFDMADFNGDDVLDLAYVGASNLEVRIGEATETYQPAVLYSENFGNVVRTADLTGDGNLDIMTAGYGANELQIYAGLGDGSFDEQPTLVTGSPIQGIDVGHLDDDDLLDLVLTTEEDLRVFYGERGGGVSSTPGTVIDGALGRVRVADIDANGVQDLVTQAAEAVEIRFSAGDESFSEPTSFACATFMRNIDIGDLNEDCVPDIVAPLGPGQDVCLLLSDRE